MVEIRFLLTGEFLGEGEALSWSRVASRREAASCFETTHLAG